MKRPYEKSLGRPSVILVCCQRCRGKFVTAGEAHRKWMSMYTQPEEHVSFSAVTVEASSSSARQTKRLGEDMVVD